MIPVLDHRTQKIVSIGETVTLPTVPYSDGYAGNWYKLVEVADWLLRARVTVHTVDGVRRRWLRVMVRETPFGPQRVAVYR